jgi:hypothetical protein
MVKEGQIVHLTAWKCPVSHTYHDFWAVVDDATNSPDEFGFVTLYGDLPYSNSTAGDYQNVDAREDTWEFPADEDVPDEVWAALAMIRMGVAP